LAVDCECVIKYFVLKTIVLLTVKFCLCIFCALYRKYSQNYLLWLTSGIAAFRVTYTVHIVECSVWMCVSGWQLYGTDAYITGCCQPMDCICKLCCLLGTVTVVAIVCYSVGIEINWYDTKLSYCNTLLL